MSTLQLAQAASPPITPLRRIESQYRASEDSAQAMSHSDLSSQRFLARRWFSLMWRASVWIGLITSIATLFLTGRTSKVWVGMVFSILAFPISLYPLLQVHSSLLRVPPKSLSRSSTRPIPLFFSALTSPSSIRILAAYLIYAVSHTFIYCQTVQRSDPSRVFGVFSPTQRHPLHLNERFIFLVLGQALVYTLIAVGDIVKLKFRPSWPSKKLPLHAAARAAISQSLSSLDDMDILGAGGTLAQINGTGLAYTVLYLMMRRSVWTFFYTHSAGILKPFIVNFVRSTQAEVSWRLFLHLQYLVFTSLLILRAVQAVLNVYVTQPLDFATFTARTPLSPDRYLLAALDSQDQYYLHFTLMELLRVSHDSARRKAIFADISKQPVLTHELWQSLLLHLGSAYQTLSTRGGVGPRVVVAAAPARPIQDSHTIALKSGDIFRPVASKRSPFSSVVQHVLDGPPQSNPNISQAVVRTEEAVKKAETVALAQIKGRTEQVMGGIEGTEVGHQVLNEARGWLDGMNDWAGREWAVRQVDGASPDPTKIRWIVDILATLAVASAEEDNYGHVQQVLPATLEAFVRLRSSAIGLEKELVARAASVGRGEKTAASESLARIPPVYKSCETAIQRITARFGSSLAVFRFPPAIASALTDISQMDQD